MTHVVCEPCRDCKSTDCAAVCPVEAFREGERMVYIDPDSCIDCEACVTVCPVEAIFIDDQVPEKWHEYIAINAREAPPLPIISQKKPQQQPCPPPQG
jgi:ferredoxin